MALHLERLGVKVAHALAGGGQEVGGELQQLCLRDAHLLGHAPQVGLQLAHLALVDGQKLSMRQLIIVQVVAVIAGSLLRLVCLC